jgi:hypothetical protein
MALTSLWFYRHRARTEDFRKRYLCPPKVVAKICCLRPTRLKLHNSKWSEQNGLSREISENKIAFCEKTQRLRSGNFSDSNSACSTVLVPVKIFQFQDMHYKNRFLGTFRGHSKRSKLHRLAGIRDISDPSEHLVTRLFLTRPQNSIWRLTRSGSIDNPEDRDWNTDIH